MSNSTTHCPLLDLPVELRLQIFGYLFEDHKDHFDPEKMGGTWFYPHGIMRLRIYADTTLGPAWPSHRPGILLSCKQLRRETMDVLYDKTLFFYFMNRPERELRCRGTFLDGGVQHLELHVQVYHTRELEYAISQLISIFEVVPPERKRTGLRFTLYAFNNYEGIRRDKSFPSEASDQAWLALSRLLRLEFGCVPKFTLDKSWQRGLGAARVEQLKQKAEVVTLPIRKD
ncbi:hypothetical protein M409DRAFT_15781 [Zasmidium cellare ATCC 36951]|uniref:F-box domain-containing protein n=1 Tax=Zasmidium cellare ATCC 36951 TaxID=1080233 RepID=A0A6A6D554_ZASCE|nr:uncharacterized protein M409DRAFT_15781 [Zasmidium cellare ATCC 36951]KAF2173500.1 hypothetical protein M409DRAFT_15781 [Zasmidium cellare ATCC 36951]